MHLKGSVLQIPVPVHAFRRILEELQCSPHIPDYRPYIEKHRLPMFHTPWNLRNLSRSSAQGDKLNGTAQSITMPKALFHKGASEMATLSCMFVVAKDHRMKQTTRTTMSGYRSPSPEDNNSSPTSTTFTRAANVPPTEGLSVSRGGCWTCRLRRKKCDEQRNEMNQCKTCVRLGIECFGWGPRRPDWMRDKEAVETYKSDLKAQLSRAGLLRGQPRNKEATPEASERSRPTTRSSTSGSANVAPQPSASSSTPNSAQGPPPSTTDSLLRYYFETVWRVQYPHSSTPNVTYTLTLEQPSGAVENAVCALASLHRSRTYNDSDDTTTTYYHKAAVSQLSDACGMYSPADAVAALHLVSFSVLSGGQTEWFSAMAVASDWLTRTGILESTDAQLFFVTLSSEARLAVKTMMYIDIMATVTVMRTPRFLSLYRRLLVTGTVSWHPDGAELLMDTFCGIPNTVLLCIAEISNLAHWKAQEEHKGTLSIPELVRRGSVIEQTLRDSATEPSSAFCSDIFRETAILYLHVVVSDSSAGIPEVQDPVANILHLFDQLDPNMDYSLNWCLTIAGAMAHGMSSKSAVLNRLRLQNQGLGNSSQACAALESLWRNPAITYTGSMFSQNKILFI